MGYHEFLRIEILRGTRTPANDLRDSGQCRPTELTDRRLSICRGRSRRVSLFTILNYEWESRADSSSTCHQHRRIGFAGQES